MERVTVVGGGLTGLIAAIAAAEAGAPVTLHERAAALGGRARTASPPYRTNFGPHALYADGPLWRWLKQRRLLPPARPAQLTTVRFHFGGEARLVPPRPYRIAARHALAEAPADASYRDWLRDRGVGEDALDACAALAGFFCFDGDPGRLSAAFVNDRMRRLVVPPSPARFLARGGWSALVAQLAARTAALGVELRTGERVDALPAPPVIVATELDDARALLDDDALDAPRADAALLDVALRRRRRDPSAVIDLDGGAFVERYTAFDPSLAPAGEELLQAHAGLRAGEAPADGVARIEAVLDACFASWRERTTWRAQRRTAGRSGAVELPGAGWAARPAVDRGGGVFLAGDAVAAPGLLAEVAWRSAIEAARGAVAQLERRPAAARA